MSSLFWAALGGMIVYLDTTAIAQLMICQPIIACPLWGLLVGRSEIGLFFGIGFQLLWLGSLPVGAAKFSEGNVGAFVATALAASVPASPTGEPSWLVLTVAAFVGILTAHFGSEITPLVRRAMSRHAPRVVDAAAAGNAVKFRLLFGSAIAIHAVAGFIVTALALMIGKWLLSLYVGEFAAAGVSRAIVEMTDPILNGLWPGLLGIGAAVIVSRFVKRGSMIVFALSSALGFGAGLLWL